MILRTWTLTAGALPERLLEAKAPQTGFTLPGAQALAAFAGLIGVEDAPQDAPAAPQGVPFDVPALLPDDVTGEVSLERELDLSALCGECAELRFSMLCGLGEALLAGPGEQPRRLCRFGDGPLVLDLTQALTGRGRVRVILRFDAARPAGICAPVGLHVMRGAALRHVTVCPQPARLLTCRAEIEALRPGSYRLEVLPCPAAPGDGDMPPARALTLRLDAGQTRPVEMTMSVPGDAFVPGTPFDAPCVRLTLREEATHALCDALTLMTGYTGAPAPFWLPLTPRECLTPPALLLERLSDIHADSVLLPAPAPDALYIALTRAGIAVRQIAAQEERARIARFPCVTFAEASREDLPSAGLSAWQLCGMTAYLRTPDPGMTPSELLAEAAGKPVNASRAQEVLGWLRAVAVRLRAEAARQGKATGALCAPGEWAQGDIRDALRTALAPTHLSALPLFGAWWTGARFSAALHAFIAAPQPSALRAEAVLEDAQGEALARFAADCPPGGGALGLIEARLPDSPCVLELTCRLLLGDTVIEESTLPVYVGERGPLEAAFA